MFEDTMSQDNFSPVKRPNAVFSVGRGSGVAEYCAKTVSETSPRCFGRGRVVFNSDIDNVHMPDSAIGASVSPTACSTPFTRPNADTIAPESLGSIISDLAQKIGESISANLSLAQQHSQEQSKSCVQCSNECVDASKLKVIIQHDVTPPPFFRGDRSDLFTVHEWEDMMYSYLNSKKCTDDAEAYDLILGRLAGKARDIVKVSLRSAPGRTTTVPSSTIFDILKRNFSELMYSNMPMADFYNTLPKANESPMDYWIRLNKAIDVADECLRRRNKCVEDPAAEAVMMFVSHCPDPSLALSLQFKPAEQWSATEIQERLDCHRRNMKRDSARSPRYTPGSACHQNTVTVCDDPIPSSTKQPELSSGSHNIQTLSSIPTLLLSLPILMCSIWLV
ncbi:uncharacterized protein LOC124397109 [Silurus meridionalis]|uniref:uncharacterized protein LOC124396931 n=1 Tax=Silurus meridionalis TaxID=175797 RepID=UPI001EEC69A6|nr:uncharacterized protein LOC124396931 [Silurus meridionalis]XP_046722562.1 uncharacterized protein LOC124397109 [Silurus meridionalis]